MEMGVPARAAKMRPFTSPDIRVDGEDEAYLPRHGAERHAEVEPHARVDREEEGEDQEGIAAEPVEHLLPDVVEGEAGGLDRRDREDQEDDYDRVLVEEAAEAFFAAHFVTFVFRVRA